MARKTRRATVDGGARHARHLRGLNLERVLNVAMDRPGSFTRSELIEATGLSAPTVGSLAAELIRSGVVKDVGTGPSSGGRRPSFMELNARHRYVAGIDVGPTRTRLAVADLRGDRVAERIVPTPTGRSPAALLERLGADLRALMKDAEAPMHRLLVVAAGAPGAVDTDAGTVSFAPNLKGWTDVPMRQILERTLRAPVLVDNDVNLAILGEHWQGAARGHQTCAFVFVGTGIGSALLIDGELHRGHNFMAGEIAVMCMGPEYVGRDFGSRGCLETLAGLQALAARWPKGAKGDPEQWMARLFEAAEAGDGEARRAVDETATFIGIAVANVAAVVDPSLVVLGGALMAQGGPLVAEVEKVVKRLARAPVEMAVSALGKDAPLCGCLLMAATEARRRMPLMLGAAQAAAAR